MGRIADAFFSRIEERKQVKAATFRKIDLCLVKKAQSGRRADIDGGIIRVNDIYDVRSKTVLGRILSNRVTGLVEPNSVQSLIGAYPETVIVNEDGPADIAGQSLLPGDGRDYPAVLVTNETRVIGSHP